MNYDQMINLCRYLEYETYESGETILNQGNWGGKLYIIIMGKVQVSYFDFKQYRRDGHTI